ncbi:MAG: sugar phosphate nucleotidyltransferase [Chloroflexota bacterium]
MNPVLVILAGGASSRMWPLSEKSLIRFRDKTLLETQLHEYIALGFQSIIIVVNPANHDAISDIATTFADVDIALVTQHEPLGMGDAILQAADRIAQMGNPPIYIVQVHDIFEGALHRNILAAQQAAPEKSYIAGYEVAQYFPGGYLITDENRMISGIIEKPEPGTEPSDLVNIVAHMHADPAALFNAIRDEYASSNPADDHYERAIGTLAADMPYQAVVHRGEWYALKYPWHVLDIMNYYLNQITETYIAESAFIAPTAAIVGKVYIGENVKIFPGAGVVGPAYIGANTVVGNAALVRNSMVLNNCEVGFTTEIARSYVANNVGMHACRVLDSVFAPHVNFSAGCTTANLRIDRGDVFSMVKGEKKSAQRNKLGAIIGESAFISVDAMTMPGIKIGRGAVVGPTTNVEADLEDGHRIYVKQEHIIKGPK